MSDYTSTNVCRTRRDGWVFFLQVRRIVYLLVTLLGHNIPCHWEHLTRNTQCTDRLYTFIVIIEIAHHFCLQPCNDMLLMYSAALHTYMLLYCFKTTMQTQLSIISMQFDYFAIFYESELYVLVYLSVSHRFFYYSISNNLSIRVSSGSFLWHCFLFAEWQVTMSILLW